MSTVASEVLVIVEDSYQEKSRVVTFKATPREIEAMNRAARILGVSRSELIREAVRRYIEELGFPE